jgi:hypothetical protein
MSLTSAGLTDIGFGQGFTANFHVQYETSLGNSTNCIANANALLAVLETEFTVTTGWFATPSGSFGTSHRQVVNLDRADGLGAGNSGYGSTISTDAQSGNSNHSDAAERLKMLFMNEWVEILMSRGGVWNAGDSSGEGLSQFLGILRFATGHYSYYGTPSRLFTQIWMNTTPRQDWVNSTKPTDGDFPSFGCCGPQISHPPAVGSRVTSRNVQSWAFHAALYLSTVDAQPQHAVPGHLRSPPSPRAPFPITPRTGCREPFSAQATRSVSGAQGETTTGP